MVASDAYRYGFQGQETDDELRGKGNSVNYKYRMHDARIGRFFAVDPLASKYPHNSVYAFSENRVLDAIELEGLEAYFVHGTRSDPSRWTDENGSQLVDQIMRLTVNQTSNTAFEWGGGLFDWGNGALNNQKDRSKAADALVDHVMATRIEGEDITLVGHSHGGNVSIQAATKLRAALDKADAQDVKIHIITIATPADNADSSLENPETHSPAIESHVHIYNEVDIVQVSLANAVSSQSFERAYDNNFTKNNLLPTEEVMEYYSTTKTVKEFDYTTKQYFEYEVTTVNGTGAHSIDYEHPEYIEEKIDDGTICGAGCVAE